jgi:cytochrome c oxidase assembly factor CtaG
MIVDGLYLTFLILACPVALFVLDTEKLQGPLSLSAHQARMLALYGTAWVAGVLGGTVFVLKWFYHSVARGKWHVDRRAWRVFTPLVSGALAFGTGALLISEVLPIFNAKVTRSVGGMTGLSFLIGYFSDNAVAALAATADRVLGLRTSLAREPRSRPPDEPPRR